MLYAKNAALCCKLFCHNKTDSVLAVPEESSVRVGVSLVPEWMPLGEGISGGMQLNTEEALA